MIRGLYTAVSGLITQEAKQQVITGNIANANTTGFKSDNLSIKKFDDVLIQNYDKIVNGKNVRNVIGGLSMGSQIDETNTDFTQGMLQETGKTTDFAIDGRGFFSVLRQDTNGNGQVYYTRDGNFHVNARGYLVTDNGDYVLGINKVTGESEPIKADNTNITSDSNNNIYLNGSLTYQFNVVDFNDYTQLKKIGDSLYSGQPNGNTDIAVKQNMLEKSNVNVISEMINMMTVMRSFESNQKVIQAMDETLGKTVNEVGSVR
jgi:flagellar basal-body rod protein FlgF